MRKKKKELIESNKFLMSLPPLLRAVVGTIKYSTKEILIIIIIIIIGIWFITSFNYTGKKIQIKSIDTQIKIGKE